MNTENICSRWFGRIMWTVIAADLIAAVIALFNPAWLSSALGLPSATPPVWPRFTAPVLILLSAFCMALRAPRWGLRPWYVWSALLLVLLLPWYGAWFYFLREEPSRTASAEEQLKSGSMGAKASAGLPYWIWLVLPRVFPEKLPAQGGYVSLGMAWEDGQELPVGFTKRTIGFPRVNMNCATCHTSSSWESEGDVLPTIAIGAAGRTFDAQGYSRFLSACASDPRFTPDVLLLEIERVYPLSFVERQLYRYLIIPATQRVLLEQKAYKSPECQA